ncbi:MAG TPA: glycosyltransferase, partial [Thermoanaerobaculia bacterium]|nr:glycosyltransferase [Thermoanaerobaculia bacterium]
MLYQARALADAGARVTLVGRAGSLPERLLGDGISIRRLPARKRRGSTVVEAARWVAETVRLFAELVRAAPDVVLLQAPPLVPAGFAALAASRIRGARWIIDWHNFGDGLLALRPRGAGAPAALLAWLEGALGRRADGHLAVSEELAAALPAARRVSGARVFRDRPHERFSAVSADDAAAFRAELVRSFSLPFSEPFLLALFPTGWGRDEDVDLLLPAAESAAAQLPAGARP